jgi:hypothetical protein
VHAWFFLLSFVFFLTALIYGVVSSCLPSILRSLLAPCDLVSSGMVATKQVLFVGGFLTAIALPRDASALDICQQIQILSTQIRHTGWDGLLI